MLLGSLPIATIDSTAPWLELLDNVVLLLQGMVSDQWDCDMVLASSFPAAFINTIVLSSIGPENFGHTLRLFDFLPGLQIHTP